MYMCLKGKGHLVTILGGQNKMLCHLSENKLVLYIFYVWLWSFMNQSSEELQLYLLLGQRRSQCYVYVWPQVTTDMG